MQLFFHGFNLLFVSRFESEDRGPMQSFTLGLARVLKISVVLNCSRFFLFWMSHFSSEIVDQTFLYSDLKLKSAIIQDIPLLKSLPVG